MDFLTTEPRKQSVYFFTSEPSLLGDLVRGNPRIPPSLIGCWALRGNLFMVKLSFMKFFPADWINDTRELSPEAKGCWIDILCLMWNAPERGVWKGTYQELARATGIPHETIATLVRELSRKTTSVTFCNDCVTLINRRMVREQKHHELALNRIRRFRMKRKCNANVTDKMLDSSRLLKMLDNTNNTPKPPPGGFELVWKKYPSKTGQKAARRHYSSSVITMTDFLDLQKALDRYLSSERVKRGFIQNGSTWFNNWRDWINYVEPITEANHGTRTTSNVRLEQNDPERTKVYET